MVSRVLKVTVWNQTRSLSRGSLLSVRILTALALTPKSHGSTHVTGRMIFRKDQLRNSGGIVEWHCQYTNASSSIRKGLIPCNGIGRTKPIYTAVFSLVTYSMQ